MLKWTKFSGGYRAQDEATSSLFEAVRMIRRGGVIEFALYVEGERYGGPARLFEIKDRAEYLLNNRLNRK
jgi:hypothetical protein